MTGEVSGQQSVPDQKLKDDWDKALAANYPKMAAELKQQIAGMPLFAALLRVSWPTLSDGEKAILPAPAAAQASGSGAQPTVAEMMAEQNRRHSSYMNMSNAMMNSYRISFITQANLSGSPCRYRQAFPAAPNHRQAAAKIGACG
jgi:hypothetical protein